MNRKEQPRSGRGGRDGVVRREWEGRVTGERRTRRRSEAGRRRFFLFFVFQRWRGGMGILYPVDICCGGVRVLGSRTADWGTRWMRDEMVVVFATFLFLVCTSFLMNPRHQ